jgi:hypothetical protein
METGSMLLEKSLVMTGEVIEGQCLARRAIPRLCRTIPKVLSGRVVSHISSNSQGGSIRLVNRRKLKETVSIIYNKSKAKYTTVDAKSIIIVACIDSRIQYSLWSSGRM